MAVTKVADLQSFLGVGVEKLQVPFAPLIRSGDGLQAWRQD